MKRRGVVFIFVIAAVSSCLGVVSCNKPEPVKIGFLGGLSGKVADLGVAGRNGAMLAIEQRNSAGGINGRPVELVVKDDEQNPEVAKKAVAELIGQNIEVIVGPMTSNIAMAVVDQVNQSKTILVSPTVTTTLLSGLDDNFLRVISETTSYSTKAAKKVTTGMGLRNGAAIYDSGNKAYTESWLNDFRKTVESDGGRLSKIIPFKSTNDMAFGAMARDLLADKPDFVVIITNAVDSASICQQIRKMDAKTPIIMSEWASTERFIEMAGTASEGVVVSQFLDRRDTSERFQSFLKAYRARFSQEPGFAGVAGYDAATVVLNAFAMKSPEESLKSIIIRKKTFQCLQDTITLTGYGDADRKTFLTQIKDGHYLTLE